MKPRKVLALAALGWASLAVAACAGQSGSGPAGSGSSLSVRSSGPAGAPGGAATKSAAGAGYAPATGLQPAAPAPVKSPLPPGVGEGPRVIRTAQITLTVGAGHFDSTLTRLISLVGQEGGYIAGTDAGSTAGPIRTGVVTFEVPAPTFQDALDKLRGLGRLQDVGILGEDVSAE